MNKVLAILGVIVLITLGGLFFCAGFFTGTNVSPVQNPLSNEEGRASEKGISMKDVEDVVDSTSATISEKIMGILSSASEANSSSHSSAENTIHSAVEGSQLSVDSLLREIAASHTSNDDCSPDKTIKRISAPDPVNPDSLHGKRIVFIGYFKNKISLEIQKLLAEKGYKTHVEPSKTMDGESFIFCGPFKKEMNAKKLVRWLKKHAFSEARLVDISNNAIEETLYEAISDDDSGMPANAEKDIPEIKPASAHLTS